MGKVTDGKVVGIFDASKVFEVKGQKVQHKKLGVLINNKLTYFVWKYALADKDLNVQKGDTVNFSYSVETEEYNGETRENSIIDKKTFTVEKVKRHSSKSSGTTTNTTSHEDIQVNIMASHAINNAVAMGAKTEAQMVEMGKRVLRATDVLRAVVRGEDVKVEQAPKAKTKEEPKEDVELDLDIDL